MKILERSFSSCRDSTQACHSHQENGQTRDLQTPCRSLCWPHNGRSCPVFLPRENKTFPWELPCSSLTAWAHRLRAVSCSTAGQPPHGFEAGNEVLSFAEAAAVLPSASPRSFKPWYSYTSWLFTYVYLRKIDCCPSYVACALDKERGFHPIWLLSVEWDSGHLTTDELVTCWLLLQCQWRERGHLEAQFIQQNLEWDEQAPNGPIFLH